MTRDACVERAALCIVGAGYAALNSLNASSKYLPRGSRVVVVDRGSSWGGMWHTPAAYPFVRLHLPYEEFTAGEREWSFRSAKPKGYRANRHEILAHFDDVIAAIVAETGIRIVGLWGHEADARGYAVVDDGDGRSRVRVVARPLFDGAPETVVVADRLINNAGFDVRPKVRWAFGGCTTDISGSRIGSDRRIHSLIPYDIGSPEWISRLRHSDAPIVVVGSGKTAMDTILALGRVVEDGDCSRIRCVAGRGSWFHDRAALARDVTGYFFGVIDMYDGTNAKEVYNEFARRGLFHSVVPDPFSFWGGAASREELDEVRRILGVSIGAGQSGTCADGDGWSGGGRIIKAHLVRIERADGGSGDRPGFFLVLSEADEGKRVRRFLVPPGTFVVNCTDSMGPSATRWDPIVSSDNLVLSPQLVCGLSGRSAHLLTHAWYLRHLTPKLWRSLPRIDLDPRKKDRTGIEITMLLCLASGMVGARMPPEVHLFHKYYPESDRAFRKSVRASFPGWVAKMQRIMPLRYDDDPNMSEATNGDEGECSVLGGCIGTAAKAMITGTDAKSAQRQLDAAGMMLHSKL